VNAGFRKGLLTGVLKLDVLRCSGYLRFYSDFQDEEKSQPTGRDSTARAIAWVPRKITQAQMARFSGTKISPNKGISPPWGFSSLRNSLPRAPVLKNSGPWAFESRPLGADSATFRAQSIKFGNNSTIIFTLQ